MPSIVASGPDRVQISLPSPPPRPFEVAVGGRRLRFDGADGPRIVTVDGLPSGRRFDVSVLGSEPAWLEASTLVEPGGRRLCRVATVSDLHVGAERWGFAKTMRPAGPRRDTIEGTHAVTSAHDALVDVRDWGPDLTVIKGDAVQHRRFADFDLLGRLVDEFAELPMSLMVGNHDVDAETVMALPASVGERALPFQADPVEIHDLPGVRVLAIATHREHKGGGTLRRSAEAALDAAADARRDGRGVLACTHHQLQATERPRAWPPGVKGSEAVPFLDRLAAANPDTLVTSGHVHRNRARRHGPLTVTEVASTRDWPGVWAAYDVYEGGITQTVLRITAPRTVEWHRYSRGAVGGVWGLWAPGRLSQRCLTAHWQH